MEPTKKIVILTRSALWKACLQRNFNPTEISWALDIDALLEEVAVQTRPAVVIELVLDSIVEDCRKVLLTSQHCHRTRFFAVGDGNLQPWLPLIRVCGFADCCRNVGALPKLISQVRREDESFPRDNLTIEERVLTGLPWKPVRQ